MYFNSLIILHHYHCRNYFNDGNLCIKIDAFTEKFQFFWKRSNQNFQMLTLEKIKNDDYHNVLMNRIQYKSNHNFAGYKNQFDPNELI